MASPPAHASSSPPLVEAILAFSITRQSNWDSVYFGKLHDRLQGTFPLVETVNGAQITLSLDHPASFGPPLEIKRFTTSDGGLIVTVGPDLIGVSVLARKVTGGHPGWAVLLQYGLEALNLYFDVTKPEGIAQVGVRYINSIEVRPADFRLGSYVSANSNLVPPLLLDATYPFTWSLERLAEVTPTFQRAEILRLAARATHGGGGELILDVDQQRVPTGPSKEFDVKDAAEYLHRHVRSVFTSIVNQDLLKALNLANLTNEEAK